MLLQKTIRFLENHLQGYVAADAFDGCALKHSSSEKNESSMCSNTWMHLILRWILHPRFIVDAKNNES